MTKPKDRGGLGLQTARGRNTTLLAKLNWRLHNEKDALWAKVLDAKYCTNRRLQVMMIDFLAQGFGQPSKREGRFL